MGSNHFEKKYQKVPIKIGISIAIAIGLGGPSQNKKNEKHKANGNGNAHANFDWYFLVLFFKMVRPHLANPILPFPRQLSHAIIGG